MYYKSLAVVINVNGEKINKKKKFDWVDFFWIFLWFAGMAINYDSIGVSIGIEQQCPSLTNCMSFRSLFGQIQDTAVRKTCWQAAYGHELPLLKPSNCRYSEVFYWSIKKTILQEDIHRVWQLLFLAVCYFKLKRISSLWEKISEKKKFYYVELPCIFGRKTDYLYLNWSFTQITTLKQTG